jgi:HAD superfamily hydrolase (TIGR01509 family)
VVARPERAGYGTGVRVPYRDVEAVFLDLGNTLVGMSAEILCRACEAAGVPATPAAVLRAEAGARPHLSRWMAATPAAEWGRAFEVWVEHMLAGLGHANGDRAQTARRTIAHVRRSASTPELWSRVLPGAPDALRRLRATGVRLIVVSNSDGTAEQSMTALGLRPLVDAVVDSAVVGWEKPDRRIFEHARALAGCAPERIVHAGDLHPIDVVGARAAGLHAVLLDPFGDWADVDCEVLPDVGALAARLEDARR